MAGPLRTRYESSFLPCYESPLAMTEKVCEDPISDDVGTAASLRKADLNMDWQNSSLVVGCESTPSALE